MVDYLKMFKLRLIRKYTSQNTIESYERDAREFLTYFKNNIKQLTDIDMKLYKQFLKSKNLKIRSINRKLVVLNQFIKFINAECSGNIAIVIEQEKVQKVEYLETAVITENEFYRILDKAEKAGDIRAVTIMYTLYLTGMRVSEMLQLKREDVNNDEFIVKGKGSKYRTVFIPAGLRDIWNQYLNVRVQKTDYLFTGRRGAITRGTVCKIMKKYTGIARVRLDKGHPHALRHLYGYMAIEDGWSIDRVATQMGHASINTTKIYTVAPKSQMKKEINEMARNRIRKGNTKSY